MRICRGGVIIAITALALLAGACGGHVDEDEGAVPLSEFSLERKGVIPVLKGYLDAKVVEYYRFGTFKPGSASWFPSYAEFPGMPANDMYVMADGSGSIALGNGQDPIIDILPSQAHYTDFFEIVAFRPDGDYTPNDIKSKGTLIRAGFPLTRTGGLVTCPVVGPEATLAAPTGTPLYTQKLTPIKVWYRKKLTHCFLLEGGKYLYSAGSVPFIASASSVSKTRTLYSVPAAEVYSLKTSAFSGADAVSNIPVPGNDIFRYGPGHKKYTPVAQVWDVTVPSDYKVGARTSYAELFPVPDFTDPGIVKRNPDAFFIDSIITVGTAK